MNIPDLLKSLRESLKISTQVRVYHPMCSPEIYSADDFRALLEHLDNLEDEAAISAKFLRTPEDVRLISKLIVERIEAQHERDSLRAKLEIATEALSFYSFKNIVFNERTKEIMELKAPMPHVVWDCDHPTELEKPREFGTVAKEALSKISGTVIK